MFGRDGRRFVGTFEIFLGGLRRLSHPKITVDAFVYHLIKVSGC